MLTEEVQLAENEYGKNGSAEERHFDVVLVAPDLFIHRRHLADGGAVGAGDRIIFILDFMLEAPFPVVIQYLDQGEGDREDSGDAAGRSNEKSSVELQKFRGWDNIDVSCSAASHGGEGAFLLGTGEAAHAFFSVREAFANAYQRFTIAIDARHRVGTIEFNNET